MMRLAAFALSCTLFMLTSCGNNNTNSNTITGKIGTDSTSKSDSGKKGKLVVALVKDTVNHINYLDEDRKRQGHWIILNKFRHLPGYDSNAKVEEGDYMDNMKEGEWIEYNANGSVKSRAAYKDNNLVE